MADDVGSDICVSNSLTVISSLRWPPRSSSLASMLRAERCTGSAAAWGWWQSHVGWIRACAALWVPADVRRAVWVLAAPAAQAAVAPPGADLNGRRGDLRRV